MVVLCDAEILKWKWRVVVEGRLGGEREEEIFFLKREKMIHFFLVLFSRSVSSQRDVGEK